MYQKSHGTHSFDSWYVNSSRVNTILRTLSMKYPTCICIPLHKTVLWKKWPCFSMVSTVCSWMQSTFCLSELSVLQAVTILVTMASRKKFWRLKMLWKSPNWRPVFSYHVPSFPFFVWNCTNHVCTVHFLCFAIVQAPSTVIACELLLIAAFLYLRVLLVIYLLVHLMHHLSTGISSQELPLLRQRTEQPLAKTTSTLMWMLLVLSMECLYMSLIWTLLMINLGENRVRIIISLKYQLPVCCLSEVDSTAPHGEVDLLTG